MNKKEDPSTAIIRLPQLIILSVWDIAHMQNMK